MSGANKADTVQVGWSKGNALLLLYHATRKKENVVAS